MSSNLQSKTLPQSFSLIRLTLSQQSKYGLMKTFRCSNWSRQRSPKSIDRTTQSNGWFL